MSFTIDSIAADPHCDGSQREAPEHGHFIAAHMRLSTAPGIDMNSTGLDRINPAAFNFVGSDGITQTEIATAPTYGCLKADEQFPDTPLSPGSKYVGTLVFDVPETHGALIFDSGNGSGWEWDF